MIALRATVDPSRVLRTFKRVPGELAKITAQELNRQASRRARTLFTDVASARWGVKPKRRIRNRIRPPRGAMRATPRRLRAWGLDLIDRVPADWFTKGARGRGRAVTVNAPGGATLSNRRPTNAQPFQIRTRNGKRRTVRRVIPTERRTSASGTRTRLPVEAVKVNLDAGPVRRIVMNRLAREWPDVWARAADRRLKRVFRRA